MTIRTNSINLKNVNFLQTTMTGNPLPDSIPSISAPAGTTWVNGIELFDFSGSNMTLVDDNPLYPRHYALLGPTGGGGSTYVGFSLKSTVSVSTIQAMAVMFLSFESEDSDVPGASVGALVSSYSTDFTNYVSSVGTGMFQTSTVVGQYDVWTNEFPTLFGFDFTADYNFGISIDEVRFVVYLAIS